MTIVLVIDMYDANKNGTTMSARRFAKYLREKGHEVRVVSTGTEEKDKYTVKVKKLPLINFLCEKQSFTFAKQTKEQLNQH